MPFSSVNTMNCMLRKKYRVKSHYTGQVSLTKWFLLLVVVLWKFVGKHEKIIKTTYFPVPAASVLFIAQCIHLLFFSRVQKEAIFHFTRSTKWQKIPVTSPFSWSFSCKTGKCLYFDIFAIHMRSYFHEVRFFMNDKWRFSMYLYYLKNLVGYLRT